MNKNPVFSNFHFCGKFNIIMVSHKETCLQSTVNVVYWVNLFFFAFV